MTFGGGVLDDNEVRAPAVLQLDDNEAFGLIAKGYDHHHRADRDDDSQGGQHRTHLVPSKPLASRLQILKNSHA